MQYAAVRRDIIEREYQGLNDRQREAVFHTEGPLLVLAGAGSGKTTVLINRIANMIRFGRGHESEMAPYYAGEAELSELVDYLDDPREEQRARIAELCAVDAVRPWEILAITFTNKAAGELKERLERAIGPEARDIWASTFHSACVRILRRDIERLGFDRSFTIYGDDEHLNIIKSLIREKGLDDKTYAPRMVASIISRAKDELKTPAKFLKEHEDDFRLAKIAQIYAEYQRTLKEANALDFDDLIMYTVALLNNFEDVREYYQKKFRYIMVDEYQDTNMAQDRLTRLLTGPHCNICVVGDDDQSIYRFRGADVENILSFEKHYPGARLIRLEQNYRSTKMILNAANRVIEHNEGRRGKELWTANEDGEKLGFYRAATEQEEAQYITSHILAGYSKGMSPRDFAVLYRMNAQSNAVENAFKRAGIPYRIVGGVRFFDRAEVRDMLSYLWAVVNHNDELRLRRIINNPARKISDRRVEDALELAHREGVGLYDVLLHARSYNAFDRAAAPMEQFAQMLEELRVMAETMPLDEFYDVLLERSTYKEALERKGDPESLGRLENVMELKSNIVDYMRTHETPSLEGFLEETALFTDIDRYDEGADAAVMMTLHSAKGLEFPAVFLVGMEEGLFPSARSMDEPAQMEEERRLCYVGITRARRKLYLSCTRQRTIFGKTSYNRMSRFIEEIPQEYIDGRVNEQNERRRTAEQTAERIGRFNPRTAVPAPAVGVGALKPAQSPAKALPLYRVGHTVKHTAFGVGKITELTPMGGDMLLTIEFEKAGRKRVMANTASKFMKIVSE
ncbi:MAG: ATP-dependent DNA helicase PcrA [Ruminococcaceae bacterium]|nr:ATP-dependent DNA helicase PcrA [Oscillospiraceae bacterium]